MLVVLVLRLEIEHPGAGGIDGAHILSPMPLLLTAGTITKSKQPLPMADALMPRSCPRIGTMKVCASQHDDKNQLTNNKRRSGACLKSCQADSLWSCLTAWTARCSCTPRKISHPTSGSSAIKKYADRNPITSITTPALKGPMKLEMAGPMESQLNAERN